MDAFTVDEALHHYHLVAKELWKFCCSSSPRVCWKDSWLTAR
ncbi:hypothetical protein Rwratislav_26609 [Rhodococcus wratislaviensis IFP 2016]|nr:hypothetical protein Rwratislav_26609 [Rhodococcus wratislaviensis IFP 2016]